MDSVKCHVVVKKYGRKFYQISQQNPELQISQGGLSSQELLAIFHILAMIFWDV